MMIKTNITAIILAGGKSSRMKEDKGLVYLNGKMMIEHVLDKVKKITDQIIIITNNPGYGRFGIPCYSDIIKDCGPMGGIYTGLQNSTTSKNLVLSCDIPFISSDVLLTLINKTGEEDVLIAAYENKVQPLCAVYDKNCSNFFKKKLNMGSLKMKEALQELNIVQINFTQSEQSIANSFLNINTPDELTKYQLQ